MRAITEEFPSPENGVSFKPKFKNSIFVDPNRFRFPSPENGVSFKLDYSLANNITDYGCFRPLKTGLVSNSNIDRVPIEYILYVSVP